jgi:phenylpropionate dioxygenase-like ring-hydroxylating dioxygenase large terminal subunit
MLADDRVVVQRLLDHIDRRTTDLADTTWREPVEHYRSTERFAAERRLMRRLATPFCPSAALAATGAYVAREAAGTPLLAVRGADGRVRVFRNACRHRGAEIATGTGCERAFVCRYHGWTYGLDGSLRHVPHEHGFPDLDKAERGLVPVAAVERHGLVYVTQDEPRDEPIEALPSLIGAGHRLFSSSAQEVEANWKVVAEGFLEGYHIRSTHRDTFYPIQYDNLNVVESFGRNSRIAFPYRRIEKQRALAPDARTADGMLTYVYHLFPNVMLATFPTNIVIAILEPLSVERTLIVNYTLTDRNEAAEETEAVAAGRTFVNAGAAEDRAVSVAIQKGMASGANTHFEFGRFEGAIVHFHRGLHAAIDGASP